MCNKKVSDHENDGESDGTQRPHCCRSRANMKSIKDIQHFFFGDSFHHFRDVSMSHFYVEHLGQGRGVQHRQRCHSVENINL